MKSFIAALALLTLTPAAQAETFACTDLVGKVFIGAEGQGCAEQERELCGTDGSIAFRDSEYVDIVWPRWTVSQNCKYSIGASNIVVVCEDVSHVLSFTQDCGTITSRNMSFNFAWRN